MTVWTACTSAGRCAGGAGVSRDYLALDDVLMTLKITPNRADCLSIKGLAREVAALTQCENRPLALQTASVQSGETQPVRIDAPQDCGRFISRVIENVNRVPYARMAEAALAAQRHPLDFGVGRHRQLCDAGAGPAHACV